MFFIKSKQIVVDAFTPFETINEVAPIKVASAFLPEWWKKMPSKFIDTSENGVAYPRSTIKRCDGLLQYYKNSIIIPLWSDIIIETDETGTVKWMWSEKNKIAPLMSHDRREYGSFFDNYIHCKIISPWVLKEKTGVEFHWGQSIWNDIGSTQMYTIVPAVLDFKHNNTTHINMFMQRKQSKFNISYGTPMVHLTPLSEKTVVVKTHVVTPQEFDLMSNESSYDFSFMGKYKKRKQASKTKSKCPFGFGG